MAQFTTIQLSKAPYILLPQHTCTHQRLSQLLNGAYNPDTGYKPRVISVQ